MNASSRMAVWALMGLLFPLQIASAQDHQITPWKHNYSAAASLGFDDGLPSQVDFAVPLLNARGLKATFFVVPSAVPVIPTGGDVTWDQWRQVAAQGHEIGSQSFSDPDLTTLTDSDLRYQLSESQRVINQNIPSQSCITLAYPFGTSNSHVQAVTSEYYATGRGAWAELEGGDLNFYEDPDPAWPLPPNVDLGSYKAVNFFDIAGNNLRDSLPLSNIYNKLDFAIAHHAWYDMYVHDIDSGFSSNDLAALLDYIVARNIWMARLGEVAQYMRERKASTLSVLSSNSSVIQLSLTNSLNGLLYTEPLTIRSIVPSAWLNVSITQGSSSTTIASTVEGSSTVVYYDALPNGGTIVLTQAGPLNGVSMSPATVQGGVSSTGTVTLNAPAPAGGAVVSLTSSDTAAAQVPALVTVLAGATTATFTATTSPVASNETVTITALYNSVSRTATLTVTVTAPVAALSGVSVSPATVQGGASSTGTVTLDAPAPAGGAAVSLTSSNTAAAQVPGSVTVLAGATTATFTATTSPVASDAAVTITALYNSVSRTATLTVTAPAPAPDFSLSAIPASQAVVQGASGSYTLTINPTNGFTGAVTLSVSGLPTGATGSFTPNPATGSSTLAVTTSSSTPVSTYTLTVTGVSGSLNRTTTVSLSVVITLPPPGVAFDAVGPSAGGASVASGSSLSWNHTVGANGMNLLLMVGVAVGAMPDTGHSLAVTYNSVPMTSVGIVHSNNQTYGYVQLFYLTAPAVGTHPVQVTLSGGTASLEAGSVSFTGVDQTTPVRNIATSFGSGVSPKVTVTSTPGDMVVDALVTGCNGTITSGKTLRWLNQVNCATAGGNGAQSTAAGASSVTMGYTVPSDSWGMIGADIVAAGGQPIDFTLGNEGDKSVVQGSAVTNTLTATLSSGITQNVAFSASGLPAGVTASFNPAGCSPTCGTTLTIRADASAALGTAPITVTATAGSVSRTTTFTLNVTAPITPDFSLSAIPASQTVVQGASGSYTLTINPTNGFTGAVTLSVSGLPTGAGGSFNTNPATSTSTLSVTTDATTTPAGSYTLTITGVSGSLTHTTTVTLVVTAPDFTLSPTPASQTVARGNPTSYGVTINPTNGFAGQVTLSVSGLPTGAGGSFNTNPATSTSTLSVTTDATTTPAGSYTLTITGVSGSLTHTTTVTLVVTAPDFTLSPTPASQTVDRGNPTSYGVTINPTNGFAGQVTLSVSGLPTGAGGSFNTNPATSTSTLSVTTDATTTPAGSYTLTITGVSGSLTHTTTVTLVVTAPDFTLTGSPASQTVVPGSPTSYTATVTPTNGFTGQVTLSVSGLPTGANGSFSPNPATSTSTLSVTTSASTPTGTYTLTFTGVSGSLTHTANVTLVVATVVSVQSLTLSPTSVVGGSANSTGTVTLNAPAAVTTTVTLSSSNTAAATVPASVSVAAGATTATFTVTSKVVSTATNSVITATLFGSATATLAVNPFLITALTLNRTSVVGGTTSATGTITLNAPSAGTTAQRTVTLASDNTAAATVPASVTFTVGATTKTFTVTSLAVLVPTVVNISATLNGSSLSVALTVTPPAAVQSLSLSPTSVVGGSNSIGTVTLTVPAAGSTSQRTVTLTSSNTAAATVPASVTVASGAATATFTVKSLVAATVASSVITATLNGSATATLTVNPLMVTAITLNPSSVKGGSANSIATITLNGAAAGTTAQRKVTLLSSNTAWATVPASVTVASGATTATFTVTSKVVTAIGTPSISASINGGMQSATLTVTP